LEPLPASERARAVRETAAYFLRLGLTAFGGPAAHIAMMRDEVVRRRGWLTDEEFLDRLGAANLLPGPSSTELAIYLGWRRAGAAGLVAAGVCFILPAFLLTLALAAIYVRYGRLPQAAAIFYGVKPVIVAIIAQALVGLARTALKSGTLAAVGAAALVAALAHVDALAVLAGGGALALAVRRARLMRHAGNGAQLAFAAPLVATLGAAGAAAFSLTRLFLFFVKVGAVLFGSGYLLLAFLRADLVDRFGWLTSSQLLDAVAAGQITPGPVFTTATFIGYLLGGAPGAVVATVGIFLPAFVFVAASGPLVARARRSAGAGAFLDGVNVAALALMLLVSLQLARTACVDMVTVAVALGSLFCLQRFRTNSLWLLLAGAVLGFVRWRIIA